MSPIGRRQFLKQAAAGSVAILAARSSRAAEPKIEILLEEPIGRIHPDLYGHFTEWGAWHRAGTEVHPAYLFGQTSTLRDALIAALTLDIFNRHADKVVMANVAQLINNLHSLFLAREEKFVVTPNFHVFEMYAAHQGGQSLRTVFSAPTLAAQGSNRPGLPGLAGSASLHDSKLVLTVVNPDPVHAREAEIALRGAALQSGVARTLTSTDIHAHNSFDQPRAIEPQDRNFRATGTGLVHLFPAASVSRLILDLA